MATLKYVGPHDAVELPSLDWQIFKQGEAVDVGDADLGNLHEQDCWEINGAQAQPPASAPEPPVDTTTPENQPTEVTPPAPEASSSEPASAG